MESAWLGHHRTGRHNASPDEVVERLSGRVVLSLDRKGKFLLAPLDDGQKLVAHLGMSGRFSTVTSPGDLEPNTRFRAFLDDGVEVRFVDPRTFGFIAVFDDEEIASTGIPRLGPDAWADPPGVDALVETLAGRRAPIKALLLDQRPISGLGNIYADEVLHLAGIHPLRPGDSLHRDEVEGMLVAIREVLASAIERGGTTLDDLAYLLPDGTAGENLEQLRVYGRAGLACRRCGSRVERVTLRGRSTHFCPTCQST